MKVGIHRCRVDVWPMHFARRRPETQPAFVPVEPSAVSVRRVRERYPLIRILRVNIDRDIPVSKVIVPVITRLVIFSIAAAPPAACRYLSKNWSADGPFAPFPFAPSLFFLQASLTSARLQFLPHHHRRANRIRAAPVARIASHFAVAIEVIFIDGNIISIIFRAVCFCFLSSFSNAPCTWQNSHSTPRDAVMNCIEGIN